MKRSLRALLAIATIASSGGPARAADDAILFDDRLAIIADSVPEFGGMYVDEDQKTLVVRVTERSPGIMGALRRAIRVVFPNEDLPGRIRLEEADFEFSRMKRWHDSAGAVFGIAGVVATDIDERANRLMIGVEDEGLRGAVATELDAAGVPPEGWELHRLELPIAATSVTDLHRPVVGGLEISGTCTLGFVASRANVLGFVTNSHCTSRMGILDSVRFTQPANGFSFVGTETVDPAFFAGGTCPAVCSGVSCRCRFSDSAFVRGDAFVALSRELAFPSLGQLAWNGVAIDVVSEGTPLVGMALRKVGRTTGHTRGTVTGTCVDTGVNPPPGTPPGVFLKCQTFTTIPAMPGDSGSPVFRTVACPAGVSGTVCAQLYGINWSAGPVIFSPMANIQRGSELGALNNCALAGTC